MVVAVAVEDVAITSMDYVKVAAGAKVDVEGEEIGISLMIPHPLGRQRTRTIQLRIGMLFLMGRKAVSVIFAPQ